MIKNNHTIFSALEAGSTALKSAWAGVHVDAPPSPQLDAQVLLASTLDKPMSYLFAHATDALEVEIVERFFAYIARRALHEPVALILGHKAFFGRDFLVSHDTLIPRPETELMVETALPYINEQTLVVDVGTGSGAIGITLACESKAPVIALDASQGALRIAQHNAQRLGVDDRISFLHGNLLLPFFPIFATWPAHFPVNHLLICANLPYLTSHQWEALNPNVKNFEPRSALVGGYSGLELYDELLMELKAKRSTLPRITLLCEIDPAQNNKLPRIITAHFPTAHVTVLNDLARLPRVVVTEIR